MFTLVCSEAVLAYRMLHA